MSVEPRMEELLASIRKAIQDDIGETARQRGGTRAGEAVGTRTASPRVSEEAISASSEASHLRRRIAQARAADLARPDDDWPEEAAVRPGPFAAVLGGERPSARDLPSARLEPQPSHYHGPSLRPSYALDDLDSEIETRANDYGRFGREVESLRRAAPRGDDPPALLPPADTARERPLLSDDTAGAAGAAFGRLAENVLSRTLGERNIEDMTRDLLRGMLKTWLDANLPALVERLVREEIERVARRGR